MASKKSAGDLVVKSKVKELLAKKNCHSSSDVAAAISNVVAWYLEQAAARAKANGRKTVRGHDIIAG